MPTATAAKTGYAAAGGGGAPALLALSIPGAPDADARAERQAEVVRVGRDGTRVLLPYETVAHQDEERLVERLRPLVAAVRDHLVDRRLDPGVEDPVVDASRRHHDLGCRHASEPVGALDQGLGYHPAERASDRHPHLRLWVVVEHLHEPGDRLGSID